MQTLISRFAKDESGATAIEYGLIATLIGVAIILGATAAPVFEAARLRSCGPQYRPEDGAVHGGRV